MQGWMAAEAQLGASLGGVPDCPAYALPSGAPVTRPVWGGLCTSPLGATWGLRYPQAHLHCDKRRTRCPVCRTAAGVSHCGRLVPRALDQLQHPPALAGPQSTHAPPCCAISHADPLHSLTPAGPYPAVLRLLPRSPMQRHLPSCPAQCSHHRTPPCLGLAARCPRSTRGPQRMNSRSWRGSWWGQRQP